MSRVLLGFIISGHGHRFECGRCYSRSYLDDVSYTGSFDPVAEFPPAELSLAVLGSWLVVLDARSVSSLP